MEYLCQICCLYHNLNDSSDKCNYLLHYNAIEDQKAQQIVIFGPLSLFIQMILDTLELYRVNSVGISILINNTIMVLHTRIEFYILPAYVIVIIIVQYVSN